MKELIKRETPYKLYGRFALLREHIITRLKKDINLTNALNVGRIKACGIKNIKWTEKLRF